jgi:hypothetical protein
MWASPSKQRPAPLRYAYGASTTSSRTDELILRSYAAWR